MGSEDTLPRERQEAGFGNGEGHRKEASAPPAASGSDVFSRTGGSGSGENLLGNLGFGVPGPLVVFG